MKNDPLQEQALAKGEDKELTFKRKTSRTRCWRAVNCGKWLNGEKKKNEGKWMHKETTRQKLMTYNSGLQIHGN